MQVDGAGKPGTLVYNSWLTMQAKGETDPDTCAFNDLALIRIDPADVAEVNPSVPGFGGPTGVGTVGGLGSTLYSYGNSELRGGVAKLSPKQGIVVQNEGNGWSHNVLTATPGVPGDSGSGFMNDPARPSASSAPCNWRRSPAQTASAISARSLNTCAPTAPSPKCGSCRAPSLSRRISPKPCSAPERRPAGPWARR